MTVAGMATAGGMTMDLAMAGAMEMALAMAGEMGPITEVGVVAEGAVEVEGVVEVVEVEEVAAASFSSNFPKRKKNVLSRMQHRRMLNYYYISVEKRPQGSGV